MMVVNAQAPANCAEAVAEPPRHWVCIANM